MIARHLSCSLSSYPSISSSLIHLVFSLLLRLCLYFWVTRYNWSLSYSCIYLSLIIFTFQFICIPFCPNILIQRKSFTDHLMLSCTKPESTFSLWQALIWLATFKYLPGPRAYRICYQSIGKQSWVDTASAIED